MSTALNKGDQANVVGLINRQDLNGQTVTLLKWREDLERWEVRCGESDEGFRIKPVNLSKVPRSVESIQELRRFSLNPVLADTLKQMVRSERFFGDAMPGVGDGQLTRMVFETFINVAIEAIGNSPAGIEDKEMLMLVSFIDFVGKDRDSELLFISFRSKLHEVFDYSLHGIVAPPALTSLLEMRTAADLSTLMANSRKGTLAHLESQQVMLGRLLPHMEGFKIQSDRQAPAKVMQMLLCGKDDSKSMKASSLGQELVHAAMGGEVTIFSSEGIKRVQVNDFFHRAYVSWLVEDVLSTLRALDARKGSLGEWHRILDWEKQLTSSITVASDRAMLDIADDFHIDTWLEGFVSLELSALEDMPGVDTDRRILRLALFAEWAFNASLTTEAWHRMRNGDKPSSPCNDIIDAKPPAFKKGSKVVLVNIGEQDPVLCSGMKGRIVSIQEPGRYGVSFSNLEQPQFVDASNVRAAEKVQREEHACVCGKEGTLRCSRCNLQWYCSSACQANDYQRHKKACKVLGSGHSLFDRFLHEMIPKCDEVEESVEKENHSLSEC